MAHSIPRDLRLCLEAKRLILTVTPGRSGTGYLAKILNYVPDVASFHEPKPRFSDVMRQVQEEPIRAYGFWVDRKLPQIASEAEPIYVETSHLFCMGFVEPLLQLGITPDLIILRRPFRQVAVSFYQLNTIPGRTAKGTKWVFSPEDPGVLLLPGWRSLHDYQLCYWHCLEIERRSEHYGKMFKEMKSCTVQVSLSEIRSIRGMNKLISDLCLPKPGPLGLAKILFNRTSRVNRKTVAKSGLPNVKLSEAALDSLEQEVIDRILQA